MRLARRTALCAAIVCVFAAPTAAQQVGGVAFEDRDGDGIRGVGEPALAGVPVVLYGQTDAGGAVDLATTSAADGSYSFAAVDGCYLLQLADPPGWRSAPTRSDGVAAGTPGYVAPVGLPRRSKLDHAVDHLRAGDLRFAALGDSIAWNFNVCGYPESFWYSKQVRDRLRCVAPGATVNLDQAAIKGEHTDDLLVDEGAELNNVFRILEAAPRLVTISMIGNDLLNVDPGPSPSAAQIDRAVAEVLDARANLQEVLSTLVSELPQTDVALNSLYDNEAWNCYAGGPGAFHRNWLPIVNRILRDLAWGQRRRVAINEVAAEFAHEDQASDCTGFDGLICRDFFQFDTIHPTNPGFSVVREKVWEAAGGVLLGPRDPLGRGSVTDADYGFVRHVRRLLPTTWQATGDATAIDGAAALSDDDGDAAAHIATGVADGEFRVAGFPDWYDEIRIVRVLAGVRYRTDGTPVDDFFRIEASLDDQFRPPPGHHYTPTSWNFYTPIVGGGGPNAPAENPDYPAARLLAVPGVAAWREVSATLGKDPLLPPGASDYEWPAVSHDDLATATLRVAAAPVAGTAGNESWEIELESAWLDLYGWEATRPAEVSGLLVTPLAGGDLRLTFDALDGAERYNVYFGTLAAARAGAYDHGGALAAPALCAATTEAAGDGRLAVVVPAAVQPALDAYALVTAHVDDVESPSGHDSAGKEFDRSQSTCR